LTFNATTNTSAPGNGGNYTTLTVVTPGIYLAHFCFNQAYTGVITNATLTISGANVAGGNGSTYGFSNVNVGSSITFQGSQIITCTASNYSAQVNYLGASLTTYTGFFYLTRIA